MDPAGLQPRFNRPVAQRYFFPEPGVVSAVDGAEAFAEHPDVAYLELLVKPGGRIGPVDSYPARAGLVITTGETTQAAVELANHVVSSIRIITTSS